MTKYFGKVGNGSPYLFVKKNHRVSQQGGKNNPYKIQLIMTNKSFQKIYYDVNL